MTFYPVMSSERHARDRELAALAAAQHGRVAVWQLAALGFDPNAIAYRARRGLLHRVLRSVYAVGHPGSTREGDEMAAVLACGPGAVLSHWSAAARWELLRPRRGPMDVTVVGQRRMRKGVRVHRVQRLSADDLARRNGIPVTSVLRTLLDLAAVAPERELSRALDEADRAGWLNRARLEAVLEERAGRAGARRLRAVAGFSVAGRTRSELEAAFLRLCRGARLPEPLVNVRVEGHEVDMYWPGSRLIVELDGYEFHRTRAAFERDRRRDADLTGRGYHVIRVTYQWLKRDPTAVTATVKALLRTPPPVQTVAA